MDDLTREKLNNYEVRERSIALFEGSLKELYSRLKQINSKTDFIGDELTILDKQMHTLIYYASLVRANGVIVFEIPEELKDLVKDVITKDEVEKLSKNEIGILTNKFIKDKESVTSVRFAGSIYYLIQNEHYLFCACLIQSLFLVGK